MPRARKAPAEEAQETPKAAAAFADYCAMGRGRSLAKYAQSFGNPSAKLRQLEEWSRLHNWQERVKEYDEERAEQRARELELMDEEHARIGREQAQRAIEQIQRLIEAKAFGSQAAVQLLKLATDLERTARGAATTVARQEVTGANGGPIEIIANASATFDSRIAAFLASADARPLPRSTDAG